MSPRTSVRRSRFPEPTGFQPVVVQSLLRRSRCARRAGSRFLTGRAPFRTGLHALGDMRPQEITRPSVETAGYHTAQFGKWHLGSTDTSPVKMGFDEAIWSLNFFDLGASLQVGDSKEMVPLEGDTSVATINLALEFIGRQVADRQPFYAHVCFGSPHKPHQAAEEFKALYQDQPEKRRDFLGELSGVDAAVGKLRAELKTPRRCREHDRLVCQRQRRDHAAIARSSSGKEKGISASER